VCLRAKTKSHPHKAGSGLILLAPQKQLLPLTPARLRVHYRRENSPHPRNSHQSGAFKPHKPEQHTAFSFTARFDRPAARSFPVFSAICSRPPDQTFCSRFSKYLAFKSSYLQRTPTFTPTRIC
jgi:hypothetical protein